MKLFKVSMFSFFILIVLVIACKHEALISPLPSPIPGSTGNACNTDSVYFSNSILPLINSGCATAGCHNATSRADGVVLTDYANIIRYVVAGNANNSKLYKEMIRTGGDRMPPPPQPAFTAAQLALVQKWINQGAKNNGCDKCDTIDFKYSTAIKPMLDSKCKGCHNPSSLGGGVDLSTYTATKTYALNGKLLGSINWSAGTIPMPKNSPKMPACEITQIQKWIAAGSLNN